ncbi:MAG: DinB family protein [Bryobacterales bacterium]|nr:DinB family protein [Bryobacterales bacterium]
MDTSWKTALWRQFGAAIDMIENAVAACPEDLWHDRTRRPEFWYTVVHTLFFLDLYLSGKLEGFLPPAPFTLSELDPAGVRPERPYTKSELLSYLTHCREKCRAVIDALTAEKPVEPAAFPWVSVGGAELLLYNMRHVQHHAAQLNLLLRQAVNTAPAWVSQARE